MLTAVDVPETGILHLERSCKLNVNRHDKGNGCLYISEENLIWENEEHRGVTLRYKDVAIHAISTDLQAFPEECLYVMYNGELLNCNGDTIENGDSQENDDSDGNEYGAQYSSAITEIRFIPQSKDTLTTMFNAMADGQCLHPDSEDSDDYYDGTEGNDETGNTGVDYNPTYEDGGSEGFYTSEEGFNHLTPQGEATLQRLENMLAQSEISRPDNIEEMAGVIMSDDEDEHNRPDCPIVGRNIDEPMEGSDVKPVEGQFDDADEN